jgi:hypothetical protein
VKTFLARCEHLFGSLVIATLVILAGLFVCAVLYGLFWLDHVRFIR